jgi:hypothetical protein
MSRSWRIALLCMAASSPAFGQVAAPATPAVSDVDLVSRALAASATGDHLGAAALYVEAYQISPQPTLLSITGTEYRAAGRPLAAVQYFCEYLQTDPEGSEAAYASQQVALLLVEGHDLGDACPARLTPTGITPPGATPIAPAPAAPPAAVRVSRLEIAGITAGSIGAVSLGVGLYFRSRAASEGDSIANHDPRQPWPSNVREIMSRGVLYEHRESQFLAVGGAAVLAGGVMYVIGHSHRMAERLAVVPALSHDGAGVTVAGGF